MPFVSNYQTFILSSTYNPLTKLQNSYFLLPDLSKDGRFIAFHLNTWKIKFKENNLHKAFTLGKGPAIYSGPKMSKLKKYILFPDIHQSMKAMGPVQSK